MDDAGNNAVTDNCHFTGFRVGGIIHLILPCCLDFTGLESKGALAGSEMNEIRNRKPESHPSWATNPAFLSWQCFENHSVWPLKLHSNPSRKVL